MITYRLYVYPTTAGQMAGQVFVDGSAYFGIGGCRTRDAVIDAAIEQIEIDADELEITDLASQADVPAWD